MLKPVEETKSTSESFPLISVIIPVYNVQQYLRECVSSVLAQVYSNLEIILIDDGSTDESGKLCDEFALSDERISVSTKPMAVRAEQGITELSTAMVTGFCLLIVTTMSLQCMWRHYGLRSKADTAIWRLLLSVFLFKMVMSRI